MTKKDYIIIAEVLRNLISGGAYCFDNDDDIVKIIDAFAKPFKIDNERFDYKRFSDYILK